METSFHKNAQQFGGTRLKLTAKAPENWWLEHEFPFGMAYFQVHLLLVSGRVVFVEPVELASQRPCSRKPHDSHARTVGLNMGNGGIMS